MFASRRTGIYESKELHKILQEDDYEKIDRNDLLPGDVLVYLDKETGDIEHSAIVVSEPDRAMLGIPRVLSKWGRSYETVHYANDCPYNYANVVYYRIKR